MSTVTQTALILKLSGMTCDHCVATVKAALEAVPGVVAADVSLAEHRAVVVMTTEVKRKSLKDAVEAAGYSLV